MKKYFKTKNKGVASTSTILLAFDLRSSGVSEVPIYAAGMKECSTTSLINFESKLSRRVFSSMELTLVECFVVIHCLLQEKTNYAQILTGMMSINYEYKTISSYKRYFI